MRVGIIGGGYAGMTAAYRLLAAGHEVSLYEAMPELGGLASCFPFHGTKLERAYHHLFTSDVHIQDLAAELGVKDALVWRNPITGAYCDGRLYSLKGARDVLAFVPMPFLSRLRMGLAAVVMQRWTDWRPLELITAEQLITRWMGRPAYEVLWKPLLRSKFGDHYAEVAAVWFWGKIKLRGTSREKGVGKECLGYFRGSFDVFTGALEQAIRDRGGEIHVGTPIEQILIRDGAVAGLRVQGREVPLDVVVVTTAPHLLARMAPDLPPAYAATLDRIDYQANVCLILELKASLSHIYWLNILDRDCPFVAAIEHTNFEPPETYEGVHVLYLSRYLAPDHEIYGMDQQQVYDLFVPWLERIYPETFREDLILDAHLMKARFTQPVVTCNYSEKVPSMDTPVRGLYLGSMAQVYPEDRGTNYAVRMGNDVSAFVLERERERVASAP